MLKGQEFKARLEYVRPYLKNKTDKEMKIRVWWYISLIPALENRKQEDCKNQG